MSYIIKPLAFFLWDRAALMILDILGTVLIGGLYASVLQLILHILPIYHTRKIKNNLSYASLSTRITTKSTLDC